MKKRFLLLALPFALLATACAGSVGAEDPATDSGPAQPTATSARLTTSDTRVAPATPSAPIPPAQPEPSRPEPATPARPAPTATKASGPTFGAPAPVPTATPRAIPTQVPARFDPNATPTPLWIAPPQIVPTSTPTPVVVATTFALPPVVGAAPGEQFQSQLSLQYDLPADWSEIRTESSIVLVDRTGKINIEISERSVEPWRYPSSIALGAALIPSQSDGWESWNLVNSGAIRDDRGYEFQYSGIKQRVEYLNFIQWFMWGDIHVQLSIEVPEFDWSKSGRVRRDINDLLDSFQLTDGNRYLDEIDVYALLEQRLDDRASGIYGRDEVVRARYELTCGQIMTDLPVQLFHLGDGIWQMSADWLGGIESWRVYEPAGSIVALDSNQSRC